MAFPIDRYTLQRSRQRRCGLRQQRLVPYVRRATCAGTGSECMRCVRGVRRVGVLQRGLRQSGKLALLVKLVELVDVMGWVGPRIEGFDADAQERSLSKTRSIPGEKCALYLLAASLLGGWALTHSFDSCRDIGHFFTDPTRGRVTGESRLPAVLPCLAFFSGWRRPFRSAPKARMFHLPQISSPPTSLAPHTGTHTTTYHAQTILYTYM